MRILDNGVYLPYAFFYLVQVPTVIDRRKFE